VAKPYWWLSSSKVRTVGDVAMRPELFNFFACTIEAYWLALACANCVAASDAVHSRPQSIGCAYRGPSSQHFCTTNNVTVVAAVGAAVPDDTDDEVGTGIVLGGWCRGSYEPEVGWRRCGSTANDVMRIVRALS
jgi:hypothetical protein